MITDLSVSAPEQRRVLVAITGGIAAYKSAILVRRLRDYGYTVRVVMTKGAQAFITPLTFQALSGHAVHCDLLDAEAENAMGHIELARWADLIVVAPATADVMAKFAHGIADDLLSTLYLATTAPVWIAPAMNQQMWAAPATQRNLKQLQADGVHIIMPAAGTQACGEVGVGRLVEPEEIATQIQQFLQSNQQASLPILQGQRVVITAGPTREAIDPVRYLSNHSSGKMGYALAAACRDAGAEVVLISGLVSLSAPTGVKRILVKSAQDMLTQSLQAVEQGCQIFIATAAVADYRVADVAEQKIKKSADALTLSLVKNPDIVATIAGLPDAPFVVGFAAETQYVEQYAQGKLLSKKLDMIACNDVSRGDIGFASDDNAMTVFFAQQYQQPPLPLPKDSKIKIAQQLVNAIADSLPKKPFEE